MAEKTNHEQDVASPVERLVKCRWRWIAPGMHEAECSRALWLPSKNQIQFTDMTYCPFCGKRLEEVGT